jgi:hypothetical protein
LHINCGGKATTAGKIKYEEDVDLVGAAKYVHVRENWGFSSTGNFWDVNTSANDYVANTSLCQTIEGLNISQPWLFLLE